MRAIAPFIARLWAIRRSSWDAMLSATNWALRSGERISTMSTQTGFLTIAAIFSLRGLSPSLPRPIIIPGLAQYIITRTFSESRSISIFGIPAEYNVFFKNFRRL